MTAPATEVTALAPHQTHGLTLDRAQLDLLKRTICENATDDEYQMFVGICKRTGLDPFSKQIYFRKYKSKDGRSRVTVITGIDGYRLMAQRTGEYEGQTEPEWCGPDGEWKKVWLDAKPPAAARVGVWRSKFREPTYAIAKWSEYYPSNPIERFMWDKMPANQIAKCAEALSLRKAFPHELSGLYTAEEMAQAGDSAGQSYEPPKPKPPRANTITHCGEYADHKQVALLHMLKAKVGGLTEDMYRKQLAAFKDSDGKPVTTSTQLCRNQISNLITRYEAKIDQQAKRAEEVPDIGAVVPDAKPAEDVIPHRADNDDGEAATDEQKRAVLNMAKALGKPHEQTLGFWLVERFGIQSVEELTMKQADSAYLLLSTYHNSLQYQALLKEMRERGEVAS